MARTLLFRVSLMAAALTATLSWGQDIDRFMLTEEDFRSLPPEAQQEYLGGTDSLNHVDFLDAHAHYRRAAELAPDSAAMQFKLFELSQYQARLSAGERRQEDFLVTGREALERVTNSPVSTAEEQRRAETQLQFLTNRLAGIESEDAGRREMGRSFLHALSLEQDWFRVGQRFPDVERTVMTASGPGDVVTRSEVVLVDESRHLFHADMTPYMDENGRHLTRDEMTDYTFEDEPTDAFLRGEPETETASATPATSVPAPSPQEAEAPGAESLDGTAPETADDTDGETPMTDEGESETGGSLSPAVLPGAALDEGGLTEEEVASSDALPPMEAPAAASGSDDFDSGPAPQQDAVADAFAPVDATPAPPAETPAAPAAPAPTAPATGEDPFQF